MGCTTAAADNQNSQVSVLPDSTSLPDAMHAADSVMDDTSTHNTNKELDEQTSATSRTPLLADIMEQVNKTIKDTETVEELMHLQENLKRWVLPDIVGPST